MRMAIAGSKIVIVQSRVPMCNIYTVFVYIIQIPTAVAVLVLGFFLFGFSYRISRKMKHAAGRSAVNLRLPLLELELE